MRCVVDVIVIVIVTVFILVHVTIRVMMCHVYRNISLLSLLSLLTFLIVSLPMPPFTSPPASTLPLLLLLLPLLLLLLCPSSQLAVGSPIFPPISKWTAPVSNPPLIPPQIPLMCRRLWPVRCNRLRRMKRRRCGII